MSIFSWKKDADSQSGDTAVSLRPDVGVPQKPRHPMEALLKTSGNAFVKVGELVDGTVLEKKGTRVYVDLGPRGMGIIYGREYYAAQDIIKKAGEEKTGERKKKKKGKKTPSFLPVFWGKKGQFFLPFFFFQPPSPAIGSP